MIFDYALILPLLTFCLGGGLATVATWRLSLRSRQHALAALQASHELELLRTRERQGQLQRELDEKSRACAGLEERISALRNTYEQVLGEKIQLQERLQHLMLKDQEVRSRLEQEEKRVSDLRREQEQLRTQFAELRASHAELIATQEGERRHHLEKIEILSRAKEELSQQFKVLASEILEEKSRRFTELNQQNIGQLIQPLQSRLSEFQNKVETLHTHDAMGRSQLAEQLRNLTELNKRMSDEAQELTQALKGSSKAQGNWGEIILESLLEAAGLRDGFEYEMQSAYHRDDGSRALPDVIMKLPEGKHMVIDSKVSLSAYCEFMGASDEKLRELSRKKHLESVRAHIKGLSGKNYQDLYQLRSLDFVLMFVPIEPAFMLAITSDQSLFMDAWDKNVLLVSPSTLLFVVRTVAHLWRQEAQSRNAQDIAKRGAELYDKLVGFALDLEKLGQQLGLAHRSYEEARSKLVSGRGNVIRQAEMLKQLGIKPSKQLPSELVNLATDDLSSSILSREKLSSAER